MVAVCWVQSLKVNYFCDKWMPKAL
jgi:hypothetical protein